MIKWATILLAAAGLTVGVYTAATASREAPRVPLAGEPSVNPFARGIAATGVVEAASRNILIAAPEGGIATRVFVEVGQQVKAGEALFELDPRPLEADLVRARAAREAARAEVARLESQPRAESIPPLRAAVGAAEAEAQDLAAQVARWESVSDPRAVSQDELNQRRFALRAAQARLEQARANLSLAEAGAWEPDLAVARAELASTEAQIRATEALLERRTVRAPIAATVLKRSIEPGQYAPAAVGSAAVILGDLGSLHIRARVDEEDLPMLRPGAEAVARIRGGLDLSTPLAMLRIEPLAEPKVDLSGSTTERVDTRVLEVVFEVRGGQGLPLYPGQQVDVFIKGPEGP